MSILWAEGFEQYGSYTHMLEGLWAQAGASAIIETDLDNVSTGRKALRLGGVSPIRRSLGGDFTMAGVAFALKIDAMPNNIGHRYVFGLRNGAGDFGMCVKVTPTGRLAIWGQNDDTLGSPIPPVAISRTAIVAGVFNHIEITYSFPQIKVYLNGKLAVEGNAPDEPRNSGGAATGRQMAEVFFGYRSGSSANLFSPNAWYDDIVAWEGDTGPIGQSGVYYLRPNTDTPPQEWELTAGATAYTLINELVPDDDSNYIFTGTVGDQADFGVEPLPANVAQVLAVIPIARVRKTDTGAAQVALGVNSGGVEAEGEGLPVLGGYSYQFSVFENDPEDDQPWSPSPMPQISIRRAL